MSTEFAGRVAVVTGSSKGIGRATATLLARAGARVVVNARHADALVDVAAELERDGHEVLAVPGNITRPGGAESLDRAAVDHFGQLDYVVNTVAVNTTFGSLLDVEPAAFEATILRNTWPTVALAQAAVAGGMGEGGAIVAVSTIGERTASSPRSRRTARARPRSRCSSAAWPTSSARAASGSTRSLPGW